MDTRVKRIWNTGAINRDEYERMAIEMGVDTLTDEQLLGTHRYSVHYGDFSMPHYSDDERTMMMLARRRQMRLEAEREAAAQSHASATPVAIETVRCERCGGSFPRALAMTSSSGTVCPDCYDEASY